MLTFNKPIIVKEPKVAYCHEVEQEYIPASLRYFIVRNKDTVRRAAGDIGYVDGSSKMIQTTSRKIASMKPSGQTGK